MSFIRPRVVLALCVVIASVSGVGFAVAQDGAESSDEEVGTEERVDVLPSSDPESSAEAKQELENSTFLPDRDDDPLTIEGLTATGEGYTLEVHGDPAIFKDLSPEELAKRLFACDDGCGTSK